MDISIAKSYMDGLYKTDIPVFSEYYDNSIELSPSLCLYSKQAFPQECREVRKTVIITGKHALDISTLLVSFLGFDLLLLFFSGIVVVHYREAIYISPRDFLLCCRQYFNNNISHIRFAY